MIAKLVISWLVVDPSHRRSGRKDFLLQFKLALVVISRLRLLVLIHQLLSQRSCSPSRSLLFMKAFFARTLLLVTLLLPLWPKTGRCADSAKKSTYPESESRSLHPGCPREVDRNGGRFLYYQPHL